jgi:hypothetical protein
MAIQDLVQKLLLGAVVSVSPIVNSGCGFEPQYVEEGCAMFEELGISTGNRIVDGMVQTRNGDFLGIN